MKRRIHIELLATAGLAILADADLCALFVFYGVYPVTGHRGSEGRCTGHEEHGRIFDDISRIGTRMTAPICSPRTLRITVVSPGGDVLFDSSAGLCGGHGKP